MAGKVLTVTVGGEPATDSHNTTSRDKKREPLSSLFCLCLLS